MRGLFNNEANKAKPLENASLMVFGQYCAGVESTVTSKIEPPPGSQTLTWPVDELGYVAEGILYSVTLNLQRGCMRTVISTSAPRRASLKPERPKIASSLHSDSEGGSAGAGLFALLYIKVWKANYLYCIFQIWRNIVMV